MDGVPLEKLAETLYQLDNHGMDPNRPYNGQPWTDQGERGKTLVEGLTFRDVCDCFVLGWLHSDGRSGLAESGTASYNEIYEPGPLGEVDPLAVMQNMTCEMERRMGIFPNIDGDECREVTDEMLRPTESDD